MKGKTKCQRPGLWSEPISVRTVLESDILKSDFVKPGYLEKGLTIFLYNPIFDTC